MQMRLMERRSFRWVYFLWIQMWYDNIIMIKSRRKSDTEARMVLSGGHPVEYTEYTRSSRSANAANIYSPCNIAHPSSILQLYNISGEIDAFIKDCLYGASKRHCLLLCFTPSLDLDQVLLRTSGAFYSKRLTNVLQTHAACRAT